MSLFHKIGVALTVAFLVLGFWDVKAVWESDLMRDIGFPLAGILVVCGALKFASNRHV